MTDNVLDLIDGAIYANLGQGDYASNDAMRWKPEPDKREEVTAEQVDHFIESMGRLNMQLTEWQRSVVENAIPALRRFCDSFAEQVAPALRAVAPLVRDAVTNHYVIIDEIRQIEQARATRIRAMHVAYRRRRS